MNTFSNLKDNITNFKDIPVSVFLAVSLTVIFSLYLTTLIKTIPCQKNIMSSFLSNFIHTDITHLMVNLFALYSLARVERDLGPKKFIKLLIFLLILNTIIETITYKIFPTIKCSIGFSSVLFGIMTYELLTSKKLDFMLLISIIGTVILPSLKNQNVSLVGHSIGAASGVIGGLLINKFI